MRCRPCFFVGGGRVVEMRCGENGNGGRVAERSESSNPMIASGNHTDSNNRRPYGVQGVSGWPMAIPTGCTGQRRAISDRPYGCGGMAGDQ